MKVSIFLEGATTMTNKETGKLKCVVGELHHILWQMWDIWKDIAIANYLVCASRQLRNHKRRNIRLFVGIAGN
jgi:VanZ family protein